MLKGSHLKFRQFGCFRRDGFYWPMAICIALLIASSLRGIPLSSEIIVNGADATFDDRLGQAAAISGNIAIIGSDRNSELGNVCSLSCRQPVDSHGFGWGSRRSSKPRKTCAGDAGYDGKA